MRVKSCRAIEVVLTAIAPDYGAIGDLIQHASEELWFDREFVLRVLEMNGWMLQFVMGDLRFDSEVISRAMSADKFRTFP